MASSTETRVIKVIADTLCRPTNEIKPDDRFRDLDADSLDMIEIVMGLEDEFAIEIPDLASEQLATVASVIALVDRLQALQASTE